MKTKFEVGQTVKITSKTSGDVYDGMTGVIEQIDSPYGFDTKVKFESALGNGDSFNWFTQGELTLVPEFENAP